MNEGELKKRFRENGGYFDEDYEMKEFVAVVNEANKDIYNAWKTGDTYEETLRNVGVALRKWFGEQP